MDFGGYDIMANYEDRFRSSLPASETQSGLVTSGAQTLGGEKTFADPIQGQLQSPAYNLLINGAMDFWQRATSSASSTTTSYRDADRFITRAGGGSSGFTSDRSTDVPNANFKYSYKQTAGGDLNNNNQYIMQRIEADNIRPYIGKTLTFSLWYKVGLGTQTAVLSPIVRVVTPASNTEDDWAADMNADTFEEEHTFNAVTSELWTRLSYTFTVPADAQYGLGLSFSQELASGNYEVYHTGWMLHEGDDVVDFQRAGRNIGEELAMCQRYHEWSGYRVDISSDPGSGRETRICGVSNNNSDTFGQYEFKVTKRALPTITLYDRNGTSGQYSYFHTGGWSQTTASTEVVGVNFVALQVDVGGSAASTHNAVELRGEIVADAEL